MAHKIIRASDGHPAVAPRRWHDDRAVALRRVNNFQTYHSLFVSFQYLSSDDVSNTTFQCDSIMDTFQFADGSSLIMGGFRGGTGGPDPVKITKI